MKIRLRVVCGAYRRQREQRAGIVRRRDDNGFARSGHRERYLGAFDGAHDVPHITGVEGDCQRLAVHSLKGNGFFDIADSLHPRGKRQARLVRGELGSPVLPGQDGGPFERTEEIRRPEADSRRAFMGGNALQCG